jgi:SAM-dependent methyltransferase
MPAMGTGVLQHLAGDTLATLRRAGLQNTVRIIASTIRDAAFDRTYGTDTAGYANPRVYAADDPRSARATFYVPTRARPFLAFLQRARVPTAGTFVDFGCGKGRALFLAAQHGFRSATGIELSRAFCAVAERNLERLRPHAPATRFQVICGDAGDYEVRDDDTTFYFYDPFDDELIERCLAHVEASLAAKPRRVAVIYHNSMARIGQTPFDRTGFLVETPLPRFDGNAFYLFDNSPRFPSAEAPSK